MIKMTKLGEWQNIHKYTGKILESFGYKLEEIEDATVKNFMLKDVLLMGDVDIEFLKGVLSRVRGLIYIGDSIEIKEVIAQFCIEKDIAVAMNKNTFTSEITVYRNKLKSIQVYSSNVFSEMEIASKYLAYTGTKISTLIKYISQIELQRDTISFDADLDEIKEMHLAFVEYYDKCDLEKKDFDQEKLLEIYETHKPQ